MSIFEAEEQLPFWFAGHTDWRIPTIKELYSLATFNGYDSTNTTYLDPVFTVHYGTEIGQSRIDGQELSSNKYVGHILDSASVGHCNFGFNPIIGRIKCYTGSKFVRFVRGHEEYGINKFFELSNTQAGIISDQATGLLWQKADSETPMNWDEAIAYCHDLDLGGHDDWRLPNAKELQSIVDYERSPDTTNSAAINPIFDATKVGSEVSTDDWGWYWTSTTHYDGGQPVGSAAVYIAFGRATGNGTSTRIPSLHPMDTDGAGAQRSEAKSGTLPNPPYTSEPGHGKFWRTKVKRIYSITIYSYIQLHPSYRLFALEQHGPLCSRVVRKACFGSRKLRTKSL